MIAQSCIECFINMVLRLTYNQFYTLCNMSLNAQVHIDCCQSPFFASIYPFALPSVNPAENPPSSLVIGFEGDDC